MAWTAPKTWSSGETLTAANFNAQIRDNELAMGPHFIARKTSDQSVTSSTALVDDNTLQLTVGANDVWQFQMAIRWEGNPAGDIQITYSFPASGRVDASVPGLQGTADTFQINHWSITSSDASPLTFGAFTGVKHFTPINGLYIGGGTAGTLKLRWAQAASFGTATSVLTHSTLWAVQLV